MSKDEIKRKYGYLKDIIGVAIGTLNLGK